MNERTNEACVRDQWWTVRDLLASPHDCWTTDHARRGGFLLFKRQSSWAERRVTLSASHPERSEGSLCTPVILSGAKDRCPWRGCTARSCPRSHSGPHNDSS